MICAGIDAGSRALKILLLDLDRQVLAGTSVRNQGVAREQVARQALDELLTRAGRHADELRQVVATGYGRTMLRFADRAVTEITCHARGVHHRLGDARTVIEIGGQDSKVIRLAQRGRVDDFAMNDRCAAGTGCFLEMVAARLDVSLAELGELARQSEQPAAISSMCAVFAETEIIGLLADGVEPPDIVAGVQLAVARRVAALAGRSVTGPVVFTGGVARIGGMADALASVLEQSVAVVPDPQLSGALGAALIAADALGVSYAGSLAGRAV